MEKKTSNFANGLIWFGAAVSIAEIMTGTMIAPLGLERGILAILVGHLIGCALLAFAGVIGGRTGKSAMETVKMSFGKKGSILFSVLNILQLIGWTAIMILNGAEAAEGVLPTGFKNIWVLVIGALIMVWLLIGIKKLEKLNIIAMGTLFILSIFMCIAVFQSAGTISSSEWMSFGTAVELSAVMPLSWLPLISDYTKSAKHPVAGSIVSAAVYFLVSSWMYMIGLQSALFTGETSIPLLMLKAGMGVAAFLVVIFSTVTTTFMDAFSAGVSFGSISKKLREKPAAIVICVVGIVLAMFVPASLYEEFLYLIGSVFAPMISIQLIDYFILKKDVSTSNFDLKNILVWVLGFISYRLFLSVETPIGSTFPAMIITAILSISVHYLHRLFGSQKIGQKVTKEDQDAV